MSSAPTGETPAPSRAPAWREWLWFAPAVLYLAVVVVPQALPRAAGCDFRHFYIAGLTFLHGADPYDGLQAEKEWQRLGTGLPRFVAPYIPPEYGTAYPPMLPFLFAPAALLPYHVARIGWLCVNLACLAWVTAFSLHRWAGAWPPAARAAVVMAVVMLDPVLHCLVVGQFTLVVTALAIAGAVAEERGSARTAGILFALAMVKFTCVLLVPLWLLLRRSWTTLLWLVLALVVLDVLPILIIDVDEFVPAFRDTVAITRALPLNDPASILGSYNVVSIDTLVYRLGFPFRYDAGAWVLPLAGAGALASLWPLRRGAPDPTRAIAWLLIVCLFFFNHRPYDVVALIPALFLLPAWLPTRGTRLWLAYGCVGLFLFASPYEVVADPSAVSNADVLLRLSYRNWALLALWGMLGSGILSTVAVASGDIAAVRTINHA